MEEMFKTLPQHSCSWLKDQMTFSPKTGTTWLKALAFAIVTREKFNEFNSPLLTAPPHAFVPFIETELDKIEENHKNSNFSLVAAHVPYTSLPESVIASD
ncbi:flavonol 4'-sulfotransferase, partial [Tanacetum coccineum]